MTMLRQIIAFLHHDTNLARGIGSDPTSPKAHSMNRTCPIKAISLSDTIFLYTENDSSISLDDIVKVSAILWLLLCTAGLPIRGAIARGESYCDYDQHYVYGKAVLEAHYYESIQDWAGIVLAPSCFKTIAHKNKIAHLEKRRYLSMYHAPTKNGPIEMYCLRWMLPLDGFIEATEYRYRSDPWPRWIRDSFIMYTRDGDFDEKVIRKIRNTLLFYYNNMAIPENVSEDLVDEILSERPFLRGAISK